MSAFAIWLSDYLTQLSHDLDVDVLCDYVTGILDESSGLDSAELHTDLAELLSAYLPDDLAHKASKIIVDRHLSSFESRHLDGSEKPTSSTATTDNCPTPSLEDRMRSLLIAERERLTQQQQTSATDLQDLHEDSRSREKRDACTLTVLREAGVAGYQSDSDEERSLEIATANADFQARQRLNAGITDGLVDTEEVGIGGDVVDVADAVEVDMQELEELSGYGRKQEARPGTVTDALAEFSSRSKTGLTQQKSTNGLSAPMTFTLSTFTSTVGPQIIGNPMNGSATDTTTTGTRRRGKKGHITVPKHIARIGAQAEAESKRQQMKVAGASAAATAANTNLRGTQARRAELDAFFFSDNDDDNLPEGGRNHERVRTSELAQRQAAATEAVDRRARDKAERSRQLAEANERKLAAQRRAQKT